MEIFRPFDTSDREQQMRVLETDIRGKIQRAAKIDSKAEVSFEIPPKDLVCLLPTEAILGEEYSRVKAEIVSKVNKKCEGNMDAIMIFGFKGLDEREMDVPIIFRFPEEGEGYFLLTTRGAYTSDSMTDSFPIQNTWDFTSLEMMRNLNDLLDLNLNPVVRYGVN